MKYAKRLLAVLLAGLLLSGCGGKTKEEQALASPDAPKAGQETLAAGAASEQSVEESWTVEPLASAQALVPYSCTEFSMNICLLYTSRCV